MRYTLGQAAKAAGVSKMTVSRAIKRGTISASKNDSGEYHIEASEFHRVFPVTVTGTESDGVTVTERYTKSDGKLHSLKELESKLEVMLERLNGKDQLIAEKEKQLTEVRQDRDDWKEQAQRLLIASQRPTESVSANRPVNTPQKAENASTAKFMALALILVSLVVLGALLFLQAQG